MPPSYPGYGNQYEGYSNPTISSAFNVSQGKDFARLVCGTPQYTSSTVPFRPYVSSYAAYVLFEKIVMDICHTANHFLGLLHLSKECLAPYIL